jgi:hypothetical protein
MRTTLDIDEDVLQAAKELAKYEHSTAGRVISKVFRQGLRSNNGKYEEVPGKPYVYKNGIPVLPPRGGEIITLAHVRKLMDEEDI